MKQRDLLLLGVGALVIYLATRPKQSGSLGAFSPRVACRRDRGVYTRYGCVLPSAPVAGQCQKGFEVWDGLCVKKCQRMSLDERMSGGMPWDEARTKDGRCFRIYENPINDGAGE